MTVSRSSDRRRVEAMARVASKMRTRSVSGSCIDHPEFMAICAKNQRELICGAVSRRLFPARGPGPLDRLGWRHDKFFARISPNRRGKWRPGVLKFSEPAAKIRIG